ncbi:MAG TPA: MFS transporter [Terriglobales bacterium]|nr:MFS transporter [Terriglobales bacterium]
MAEQPPEATVPPPPLDPRLRRNVPLLGFTALFNDTASEMAYWVLPYFITLLGAGPALLGVIEGGAESAASLVRVFSGYLTDRQPRRKPLVVAGYLVANLVKPLLGWATAWPQVLALRVADRGGKGFRGAPRDVMISESVDRAKLGAAFGLRQALDSAGAILGPALAYWIMARSAHNVRLVFWLAAIPGGIAVALAWGWLRETGGAAPAVAKRPAAEEVRAPAAPAAAFPAAFYQLLAAVALFGIANFSDMFLILRAQQLGISPAGAPLLGLVFNAVFAGLSYPFGGLSDRWRRKWLIGSGYLLFAWVYWSFGVIHRAAWVWPLFAIYGLYQAMSAGVLSALVAETVGPQARGRAFGWVASVAGGTALAASVLAGWLWHRAGPALPFELAAVLAVIAAGLIFAL